MMSDTYEPENSNVGVTHKAGQEFYEGLAWSHSSDIMRHVKCYMVDLGENTCSHGVPYLSGLRSQEPAYWIR